MTTIPDRTFLFTRGLQSVRLVRQEHSPDHVRLFVHWPGAEVITYEFGEVTECMKRQAEIEQLLVTSGYHIVRPAADRRREGGTWDGPDSRHVAR